MELNILHLSILLFTIFNSYLLQAVLVLSKIPSEIVGEPLDANRLYDAVNVILSLQVRQTIIRSRNRVDFNHTIHNNC